MAQRSVVWTTTELLQRRYILKYWNKRNKSNLYSVKLVEQIKQRTSQLAQHPLSGKNADFPETRVTSLGHYSIFYKYLEDQIVVTSFWDNRQGSSKLLLELKKSN